MEVPIIDKCTSFFINACIYSQSNLGKLGWNKLKLSPLKRVGSYLHLIVRNALAYFVNVFIVQAPDFGLK